MSSECAPCVSTFKHGYEDSDVMQNTTAGYIVTVNSNYCCIAMLNLSCLHVEIVTFGIWRRCVE